MMIRINLLPEEFRRAEGSSPKVFAATIGAIIAVSAAFGWFGKVYFGDLAEAEAQHQRVTETLNRKTQGSKYFDDLEKQRKDYSQRVTTIQTIGKSRRLWTEFLDQVIDVTSNNTDLERHLAWFNSVKIRNGNNPKKGPIVTLPGAVQGREITKVSNLHKDLSGAPFFADVASKSPPTGKVEFDKSKTPEESYGFSLTLEFRPAGDWMKNGGPKPAGKKK